MATSKLQLRNRRRVRIRLKVHGTVDRPRLTVYRSLKHMYAQVIDDDAQRTLAHVSTLGKANADVFSGLKKTEQAKKLGKMIAEACQEQGIKRVVFDRNGYRYHGRVEAVAAAAREAGIEL